MPEELDANRQSWSIAPWFVNSAPAGPPPPYASDRVDWWRSLPFFGIHLMCLGVIWVGWSPVAAGVALFLYCLRMFAITAFYHRYFSHRAFKTSRACQLAFAVLGCSAVQRGPLWWAAHHRRHHVHSDEEPDLHSPRRQGLLWSHMGWFLSPRAAPTDTRLVPDLAKYPELRFLDRFETLVPALLAVGMFLLGELLAAWAPELGTSGLQMLIWGFFISTVACYHATYLVNSLAHRVGRQVYKTNDDSRNSFWIALLTFGEGWHNNHHFFPSAARQGFRWWEIDVSYYLLVVLSWFGLIWGLKSVPDRVLKRRIGAPQQQEELASEAVEEEMPGSATFLSMGAGRPLT
jgi:stearoyl-CoA desaturase (delta-9 desaturase)